MDRLEQAMHDQDINFIQYLLRAYPKLKHHVFEDGMTVKDKLKQYKINISI